MTKSNSYYSYFEGVLSIIINLIIFAIKYWAGILTGSVAFIADAWHSLSDSVSSIIVIIGAKASSKPADKEHPYGHGRAEYIASLIIGVFLAIVAYNFIIASWNKFQEHEIVIYNTLAIWVLISSIVLKEALAQYAFYAARKTNSPALKADGWHHRSDALSSVIILIGVFVGKFFWWIDAVLGMIVALMIFWAAIKIFKETASSLLGEEADNQLKEKLKRISNETSGMDVKAHHFHLHHYGNHNELTFHIKLPKDTLLVDAHKIATNIERNVKRNTNIITTIKTEPVRVKK